VAGGRRPGKAPDADAGAGKGAHPAIQGKKMGLLTIHAFPYSPRGGEIEEADLVAIRQEISPTHLLSGSICLFCGADSAERRDLDD